MSPTIVRVADDSASGRPGAVDTHTEADGTGGQSGSGDSTCYVTHEDQVGELHLSRESAERLLASGSFFWLDVYQPTDDDFAVLRDVFGAIRRRNHDDIFLR